MTSTTTPFLARTSKMDSGIIATVGALVSCMCALAYANIDRANESTRTPTPRRLSVAQTHQTGGDYVSELLVYMVDNPHAIDACTLADLHRKRSDGASKDEIIAAALKCMDCDATSDVHGKLHQMYANTSIPQIVAAVAPLASACADQKTDFVVREIDAQTALHPDLVGQDGLFVSPGVHHPHRTTVGAYTGVWCANRDLHIESIESFLQTRVGAAWIADEHPVFPATLRTELENPRTPSALPADVRELALEVLDGRKCGLRTAGSAAYAFTLLRQVLAGYMRAKLSEYATDVTLPDGDIVTISSFGYDTTMSLANALGPGAPKPPSPGEDARNVSLLIAEQRTDFLAVAVTSVTDVRPETEAVVDYGPAFWNTLARIKTRADLDVRLLRESWPIICALDTECAAWLGEISAAKNGVSEEFDVHDWAKDAPDAWTTHPVKSPGNADWHTVDSRNELLELMHANPVLPPIDADVSAESIANALDVSVLTGGHRTCMRVLPRLLARMGTLATPRAVEALARSMARRAAQVSDMPDRLVRAVQEFAKGRAADSIDRGTVTSFSGYICTAEDIDADRIERYMYSRLCVLYAESGSAHGQVTRLLPPAIMEFVRDDLQHATPEISSMIAHAETSSVPFANSPYRDHTLHLNSDNTKHLMALITVRCLARTAGALLNSFSIRLPSQAGSTQLYLCTLGTSEWLPSAHDPSSSRVGEVHASAQAPTPLFETKVPDSKRRARYHVEGPDGTACAVFRDGQDCSSEHGCAMLRHGNIVTIPETHGTNQLFVRMNCPMAVKVDESTGVPVAYLTTRVHASMFGEPVQLLDPEYHARNTAAQEDVFRAESQFKRTLDGLCVYNNWQDEIYLAKENCDANDESATP